MGALGSKADRPALSIVLLRPDVASKANPELQEVLGSGSSGVVRAAIFGTRVAAKCVPPEVAFQTSEVDALKQSFHPRIVQYLGTAIIESRSWILMELCGPSLKQFLTMVSASLMAR